MDDNLPANIGARFGDWDDLPEALLSQLPAARVDPLEREIIELIRERFEGVASVDEILVGLYRKTQNVYERAKIAAKLYRMVNSKPQLLASVEKKRGVYRLP